MIYQATPEEVEVATLWHGGQGSMFYAVSSTGALSRGTQRPYGAGVEMTNAEWQHDLAWRLLAEIRETMAQADKLGEMGDLEVLRGWYVKVSVLVDDLEAKLEEEIS